MNATKVEAAVRRVGPDGAIVAFKTCHPNEGVVLALVPSLTLPWVTWLWWTTYTDGTTVPGSGASLASGHYHDNLEAALADFAKRR